MNAPTPEAVRAAFMFITGNDDERRDAYPVMKAEQREFLDKGHPESVYQTAARILAAALRQREWQPIETAPRDNKARAILHVVHPADEYARKVGHPEGWSAVEVGIRFNGKWNHDTAGNPTHWQPLPDAPGDSNQQTNL